MTGVLVTGGTGKTGRALVALLRDAGVPVRVASRAPSGADPDAVRFDWDDPAGHPAALRGADRVYLVPPPFDLDPVPQVGPFLSEAERLGVRRLVLLGSAIVIPGAPGALELAERVRAHPGWVVLRPSGFMQNLLPPHPLAERIRRDGVLPTAAGAGRLGWIDARDIAAAAAALLADPDSHPHQRDHLLTGPQALGYADVAATISGEAGRPVRVEAVAEADVIRLYRDAGVPAPLAHALAAVDAGLATNREDRISTAVLDLTGRPPRTLADFVREHAGEWRERPGG